MPGLPGQGGGLEGPAAAQGDRRAAVRQWETCRRALRDELDVAPSAETEELRDWIEQSAPQFSSVESAVTNLPMPTTRYIERPAEERAIRDALESNRLLTLTGAAGGGKTRLAVRIATQLLGAFRDGAWFVDLATASSADQLLGAVARILGVKESPGRSTDESLAAFIRPRQMLILLDNCERVVPECAALLERRRLLVKLIQEKIDEIRKEYKRILDESGMWDGEAWSILVTGADDRTITVRALSAAALVHSTPTP